jgi:hypothetical protein
MEIGEVITCIIIYYNKPKKFKCKVITNSIEKADPGAISLIKSDAKKPTQTSVKSARPLSIYTQNTVTSSVKKRRNVINSSDDEVEESEERDDNNNLQSNSVTEDNSTINNHNDSTSLINN